jgi:transcriptional regulator with XRE-family HTH domain
MNIKVALGNRIRSLRERRGYSQSQLAEKIDMSVHAVSMAERGKNWPSASTIDAIANALEVRATQLLDRLDQSQSGKNREALISDGEASLRSIPDEHLKAAVLMLKSLGD